MAERPIELLAPALPIAARESPHGNFRVKRFSQETGWTQVHPRSIGPLRVPHWRLSRVMELMCSRQLPRRWCDDYAIRVYRRLLLELADAGTNEDRQEAVCQELATVYEAHGLHYSPDVGVRQELEARLLTGEPFAQIAQRMGADPESIEYYSQLFFDVRDRLQSSSWIYGIIRHRLRDEQRWGCSVADAQRGYVLRLLAYVGGPHVLEALTESKTFAERPQRAEDVPGWCDKVLSRLLPAVATAAAATIEIVDKSNLRFIKTALSMAHSVPDRSFDANQADIDARLARMLSSLGYLKARKPAELLNSPAG